MKPVDSTEGLDTDMLCLSGSVLCLLLCQVLLNLEKSVGCSVPLILLEKPENTLGCLIY